MNRTALSNDTSVRVRRNGRTVRDHRADRIARLRQLVASGQYKVDLMALAGRLLDAGILRDLN